MRILFAEDDPDSRAPVQEILKAQNLIVDVAESGTLAWDMIQLQTYDLLILDVVLPGLDGIGLCQRLRQHRNATPILLLTARDTVADKLQGLEAGADDYLVKSADVRELMARVWALLRRQGSTPETVLRWGPLQLNSQTRMVTYGDEPLAFSRKEYQVLELLLRYPRWVFSRRAIVDRVWGWSEDPPTETTVKSHIKAIRRKLKAVHAGDLIKTVHGQGYCLNPDYQTPAATTTASTPEPEEEKLQTLQSSLTRLWDRARDTAYQRLDDIEQLICFPQADIQDGPVLDQILQLAHKLAGSLGTFGLEHPSRLALRLERLVLAAPPLDQLIPQVADLVVAIRQGIDADSSPSQAAIAAMPTSPPNPISQTSGGSRLLIVDADLEVIEPIVVAAQGQLQVEVQTDLAAARQALQQRSPDILLLDVALQQGKDSGLTLLQEIADSQATFPVVVFSSPLSLKTRLQAMQWGAKVFLQRWTMPDQVCTTLRHTLGAVSTQGYHVLAVDDDPQQLALLSNCLGHQGIRVTELHQPTAFWDTLTTVKPDLVLLDVQMPGMNGLDLCRLVQSDGVLATTPVVMLTNYTDPDTRIAAFQAGAEEFLAKTAPMPEILQRLSHRLEQSRLQQQEQGIDPITGLTNRREALRLLQQILTQAARLQQSCWMAVVELDLVVESQGDDHARMVDQWLGQFAYFLQQHCPEADVLAHWRDGEFIIAMLGQQRQEGVEQLARLLELWQLQEPMLSPPLPATASLSAGVAQYPLDGSHLDLLYRTADAALYQAKLAGGNRILSAKWLPLDPAQPHYDVGIVGTETPYLKAVVEALIVRGNHVQWWSTAEAALDCLQGSLAPTVRVLLLAVSVADQAGITVLKSLPLKLPYQPQTLALLEDQDWAETMRSLGVTDYVTLPCDVTATIALLYRLLQDIPGQQAECNLGGGYDHQASSSD